MTLATRLASIAAAVLAFAAVTAAPARAQAPGDCACAAPAPTIAATAAAPRKLGVSLRLSSLSLHPAATPEEQTDFGGAGVALSYRFNPRWGVAFAAEHFTEQLEDGSPGARELQSASLSATFHLRPYRSSRWDAYLIAGLGVAGEVSQGRDAPTEYQTGHLGAGLERRFHRLGLSAELRLIGMQEPPPAQDSAPSVNTAAVMEPPATEAQGTSGGQLSLAATYYF